MIKIHFTWGWLLLALFTLTACTPKSGNNNVPESWLTKGVKVNLPSPQSTHPLHDQQLLTVTVEGKDNSLIALVDSNGEQLTIAGLSTMGIRLFKINYQGNEILTEQAIFIPQLPPATQVLSDIMLSYWPQAAWQAVLPSGWQLIDQDYQRKLYDDKGALIIEMTYPDKWQGTPRKPSQIIHHIFGYQINIQSMG